MKKWNQYVFSFHLSWNNEMADLACSAVYKMYHTDDFVWRTAPHKIMKFIEGLT